MKTGMSTASYDMELDTDVCNHYSNANLTITLNIGFRQINWVTWIMRVGVCSIARCPLRTRDSVPSPEKSI